MIEKFIIVLSDYYNKDKEPPGIFIWRSGSKYKATVRHSSNEQWYTIGLGEGETVNEAVEDLISNWLKIIFPGSGLSNLIDLLNSNKVVEKRELL